MHVNFLPLWILQWDMEFNALLCLLILPVKNAFDDILDQKSAFVILIYDDIKVFISGVATISKKFDTINHCKSRTFYHVFNKFQ